MEVLVGNLVVMTNHLFFFYKNKNKQKKKENVKNSFGILNKEELKGKDVILFDDIYTTGSTIEECSKILKEHDTRKVYFLSISISNNKN